MKYWLYKGKKIAYHCAGTGPCVVLIHGFMESQNIWKDLQEKLAPYGKIITLDLPGHGHSEGIGDTHSPQEMASIVDQLLTLEKVDKAFVVGHSMGGYVAAEFAAQFPHHCDGIAFFHSHAARETDQGVLQRNRVISLLTKNKKDFIASFIPDLFSEENRQRLAPEINEIVGIAQQMKTEDIIAAQKGMRDRADHLSLLASTPLPVWFIHGKYDLRCREDIVWNQALRCQNARVFILPTGHNGYLEAPALTREIFLEYLLRKNCSKA